MRLILASDPCLSASISRTMDVPAVESPMAAEEQGNSVCPSHRSVNHDS